MTGRRSNRAGSGKIGCQQNYSPTKQKSAVFSTASRKHRFNVAPDRRTSEIPCQPMEEQNQHLTTGLSQKQETRFVPGCRTMERFFFVSVKIIHARHVQQLVLRVPDQDPKVTLHRVFLYYVSDKSSVMAKFKLRMHELQGRFASGGGECILVPGCAGSSFVTTSLRPFFQREPSFHQLLPQFFRCRRKSMDKTIPCRRTGCSLRPSATSHLRLKGCSRISSAARSMRCMHKMRTRTKLSRRQTKTRK